MNPSGAKYVFVSVLWEASSRASGPDPSLCFQLLYSVALWHGVQAALYRAIKAQRARSCEQRGLWRVDCTVPI